VKTTLVVDDAPYRQAKVAASARGCTVSALVEDALRLLHNTGLAARTPSQPMPTWDLGRPRIDIDDGRAVRGALDFDLGHDARR